MGFIQTALVTGANGFVGRRLVNRLVNDGYSVRCASRRGGHEYEDHVRIQDISESTDWTRILEGVDILVHSAARVLEVNYASGGTFESFMRVNASGTLKLAQDAAQAGVRRFIFISTAKVNGESSRNEVFTENLRENPIGYYAISKLEAERGLWEIVRHTGMEVVIIRPPLIYGPGVKANFQSLMKWVNRGVPLPLGGIHNLRSLLYIDNLVDFVCTCICHPAAANEVFFVSDDQDLSVAELVQKVSKALEVPSKLISLPSWVLRHGLTLIGRSELYQRLCESFQVDISKAKKVLGWEPRFSVDYGLSKTVDEFLNQCAND